MKKNMMNLVLLGCAAVLLSGVSFAQSKAEYRLVAEQSPNAYDSSISLRYAKRAGTASGQAVHKLTFRLNKVDFELSQDGHLIRQRSERPITLRVQAGSVSPFLVRQLEACASMFSESDPYESTTALSATFTASQSRMSAGSRPIVLDSEEVEITSLRCITTSNN